MINRRDGTADYLNPYSSMRLSRSGRKNIKDQFGQYKSLVVEKVLPYLDNVEQIDFGMSEDDEEEARNEEDSEDEDDEDDI